MIFGFGCAQMDCRGAETVKKRNGMRLGSAPHTLVDDRKLTTTALGSTNSLLHGSCSVMIVLVCFPSVGIKWVADRSSPPLLV